MLEAVMRRFTKRFMLLIMLIFGLSVGPIGRHDASVVVRESDFFKPLNQRLVNEASDFEHSAYIEHQVNRFMESNGLIAASIAIIKDEQLVYSRAFGYSDLENKVKASPDNLFRIASVSKLITAVAIMQLVEEGKICLDNPVFGKNGYINEDKYLNYKDRRVEQVTIRHLLSHTSGFSNRYGDPMFLPHLVAELTNAKLPLDVDDYLNFALGRRLHFTPGFGYGYSNMGYVFLGEVIKRVTGMDYEAYVQFNVLNKMGICDMHIGKNRLQEKRPNEVKYYENGGFSLIPSYSGTDSLAAKPYGGNNIELLGAAGGWIASAPELARMLVSIDGFSGVKDIISQNSIQDMTNPDTKPLGWMDTSAEGIWFRTGNFAGTSAMLCRRPDNVQWVFLTNTSSWKGHLLSTEINRMMTRIVGHIDEWPQRNLFQYFNTSLVAFSTNTNSF
jgi:CubicO group peptidase (beta-lactamase class C family)